jgi:chemotaxis protein MotA
MAEHAEKLSGDRMPVLARRTMFDGATVLGLAGGLLLVVLAIGLGGSASAFFNIPGLLIVVGGTFAVTTVCFTMSDVARTIAVIGSTFMSRERDPQDVSYTMLEVSDYCRKHGVLRLQGQPLQRFVKEPLLFKALSMLVEGVPEKDIADILNEDLAATTARVQRSANLLRKAAEISPAMGLIGTLIGLVQMLGNLSDPSVIGPAMAVALLTTFYGVVLANMVFNPLAAKLERNAAEEHLIGYIYTLGTLSIIRKDPPRRLEMLLNSALPPESKVRFAGERD